MKILLCWVVLVLVSCSNPQKVALSTNPPTIVDLIKSVPMIVYNGSAGSGILFKDADGCPMLLTAAHTLEDTPTPTQPSTYGTQEIRVFGYYPNTETVSFTSIGTMVTINPILDYAILSLDSVDDDMYFIEFDFNRPEQGDSIYMIGSPSMDVGTISKGIVCHSRRHPKLMWNAPLHEFIQTDATGGMGNSGGGLFSTISGKCVGMLVLKNGENNLMLSLPIDIIEADLQSSLLNKLTLK